MIGHKNKVHPINIQKIAKKVNKKYVRKSQSLQSIFRSFCDNSSIHGCNRISSKHISMFERTFWICLILFSLCISAVLLTHLWNDYMTSPTLITAEADIPINKVVFPGIAVCDINKISKKRAYAFAEFLLKYDDVKKSYSISKLLSAIKLLVNLYDFNVSDNNKAAKFQDFLEKYDNLTRSSDPTDRLIELAPSCEEALLNCKWGGIEYDCQKLFVTRTTFDGFCCVFNNARPISRLSLYKILNKKHQHSIPTKPWTSKGTGVRKGLQLVLNNNLDDYFATIAETRGYKVLIFNSLDFPDKASGSLTEIIADSGTEVFIGIKVNKVNPTNAIRIIPPKLRECVFDDETNTGFGMYRFSDCLADCTVQAMKYLCKCIPFFEPLEFSSYCTLVDLNCMSNFKRKWTSYYPTNEETSELNFERIESIRCEHCFPTCKDVRYAVSASPIIVNRTNNTFVNIFFEERFANSFKRDLNQTWYELVSSFGGFMSLIMGLSFISFAELLVLLYKIVVYWFR